MYTHTVYICGRTTEKRLTFVNVNTISIYVAQNQSSSIVNIQANYYVVLLYILYIYTKSVADTKWSTTGEFLGSVEIIIYYKHVEDCFGYNNIISTRKREIFSIKSMAWSFKASRALLYITFNKHMLPISINMTICDHYVDISQNWTVDFTLLFISY